MLCYRICCIEDQGDHKRRNGPERGLVQLDGDGLSGVAEADLDAVAGGAGR